MTKLPAVVAASKSQVTWPRIATVALPVVPAPAVTIPIAPAVSAVVAITAVLGAPVNFAKRLVVVPVLPAFAIIILRLALPILVPPPDPLEIVCLVGVLSV